MDILKLYITELLNLVTDINNRIIPHDHQVKDFKDQINWLIEHPEIIHNPHSVANCRLAFHPWLFNLTFQEGKQANYIKYPFIGIFNTTGSIYVNNNQAHEYDLELNKFKQIEVNYHRDGYKNSDRDEENRPRDNNVKFSPDLSCELFIDLSNFGSTFIACIDVNTNRGILYLVFFLPPHLSYNTLIDIKSYDDLCSKLIEFNLKRDNNFNFLNNKNFSETTKYTKDEISYDRDVYYKGLKIYDYSANINYKDISYDVKDVDVRNIPFYKNHIEKKIPEKYFNNNINQYHDLGKEIVITEQSQMDFFDPEKRKLIDFDPKKITWEFKIYIFKELNYEIDLS